MENILKTYIQEIGGDAQRQYIDARSVFTALEEAKRQASEVRGGMLWQNVNGKDYLVRTTTRGKQTGMGLRSDETEKRYEEFTARKQRVEKRVSELRDKLDQQRRLNKAYSVGRAPEIVVNILNKLEASGLAEYFTVIGTHSLYAYEAAAGVRIASLAAMETRDVDLLWDTRKRISFMSQMELLGTSFLGVLRQVDPTFEIRERELATAVNNQGFEVDVIRREAKDGDPHPLRLTDHEEEFYADQAIKAGVLLDGKKFSAMIVSATGRMARMNTISPVVFASFKRWLGEQENREPVKRKRDILQASLVEEMVREFFPQL